MIGPVLDGVRILICRPEPSASALANVLESVGAECQRLPTLLISEIEPSAEEKQCLMDLDQYQHVIVVSQHAATIGLNKIDQYWPQFPVDQNWFAIGRKTAETLNTAELSLSTPENDLTSERLLEHPELKRVKNQKILILKGQAGRETLKQKLEGRGAHVDTVELYCRQCPKYSDEDLQQALDQFDPHFIIALSGQTLENLISLGKKASINFERRHFILSSSRVANIAFDHGLKLTHIAKNLMPIDIIRCIKLAMKANQT